MMLKPILAAAAIALVGVPAFAADNTSGLTRAEVQAELVRARAAGETMYFSESYGYAQAPQVRTNLAANQAAETHKAAANTQAPQEAGRKAAQTTAE